MRRLIIIHISVTAKNLALEFFGIFVPQLGGFSVQR
jgi:hypothetical protein